jgi:diaminohydroxyphosphoribosylaminopyrimidine deaminase/5-amino-6-(5-phosphoribosylamino)uracil reductase
MFLDGWRDGMEEKDAVFMARALELAKRGSGYTNPNPMVGAVVVKDGQVISEGFHSSIGKPHAEREALSTLDKNAANGATLYVNLEPCCHFGRTPPCVELIKEMGIARVVIAMEDVNPKVSGKGINMLCEAGIEVTVGVLRQEAMKLNEIFIKYMTSQYPFVTMKSAMTLDGKIASRTGDAFWISGEEARKEVHMFRQKMASVMVGVNTVIADNPRLTVRLPDIKPNHPLRIVVDSQGRTPLESYVVKTASKVPTLIATTEKIPDKKVMEFENRGVIVVKLPESKGQVDMEALFLHLHKMEIDSVLLEGGGSLNASALEQDMIDKFVYYVAPKILGGKGAPTPVEGLGRERVADSINVYGFLARNSGEDICLEGYIHRPPWMEGR